MLLLFIVHVYDFARDVITFLFGVPVAGGAQKGSDISQARSGSSLFCARLSC